jgi:hypothetical protein
MPGTIAEVVVLAQQFSPNPRIQRLQYLTQRALVQLDGQHPVSFTRNQPSRSKRHGDTAWSLAPPEEAPGAGGTTITNAMRATRPRVSTMNKKYNNPLATSVVRGIKAKIHSRPTFMMLPQLTLGRRSMKAATRGVLLKRGEGIVPARAMTTTATASLPSPTASPISPIQRTSNQSES